METKRLAYISGAVLFVGFVVIGNLPALIALGGIELCMASIDQLISKKVRYMQAIDNDNNSSDEQMDEMLLFVNEEAKQEAGRLNDDGKRDGGAKSS